MFRCLTRSIECQQRALRIACLLFDRQHERPGNAGAASSRMDQQFLDLASMWLIRRCCEIDLDRADDLFVTTSDDNATRSVLDRRQHFVTPESRGFFAREWKDKTYGGAGVHAVVQEVAEQPDILIETIVCWSPEYVFNQFESRVHRSICSAYVTD